MKNPFLLTTLLLLSLLVRSRAQDEPTEESAKDGKVQYALILPEEKAPELVKPNEASPFGGLADDKDKDTSTGEETKVGDTLRSLPVVGKSSRNCVLLGDIILRRGQIVPPVIPNQTVQLKVNDITPDHIELVWLEKKTTGLPPRTLTIATDVTPQVKQRLPGSLGGAPGSPGAPVMAVMPKAQSFAAGTSSKKPAPRAQPVQDQAPADSPAAESPGSQTATAGSSLLNLFFGNQVKDPVKPGDPKPEEEEAKPGHDAKP